MLGKARGALLVTLLWLGMFRCQQQNSRRFRRLDNHVTHGHVFMSVNRPTISGCAAVCLLKPNCQGFRIWKPAKPFLCSLLETCYWINYDVRFTTYYSLDNVNNLPYKLEKSINRIMYIPPAVPRTHDEARAHCHHYWGNAFTPLDQAQWEWMKQKAQAQGYDAVWIPAMDDRRHNISFPAVYKYVLGAHVPLPSFLPIPPLGPYNANLLCIVFKGPDFSTIEQVDCGASYTGVLCDHYLDVGVWKEEIPYPSVP